MHTDADTEFESAESPQMARHCNTKIDSSKEVKEMN